MLRVFTKRNRGFPEAPSHSFSPCNSGCFHFRAHFRKSKRVRIFGNPRGFPPCTVLPGRTARCARFSREKPCTAVTRIVHGGSCRPTRDATLLQHGWPGNRSGCVPSTTHEGSRRARFCRAERPAVHAFRVRNRALPSHESYTASENAPVARFQRGWAVACARPRAASDKKKKRAGALCVYWCRRRDLNPHDRLDSH